MPFAFATLHSLRASLCFSDMKPAHSFVGVLLATLAIWIRASTAYPNAVISAMPVHFATLNCGPRQAYAIAGRIPPSAWRQQFQRLCYLNHIIDSEADHLNCDKDVRYRYREHGVQVDGMLAFPQSPSTLGSSNAPQASFAPQRSFFCNTVPLPGPLAKFCCLFWLGSLGTGFPFTVICNIIVFTTAIVRTTRLAISAVVASTPTYCVPITYVSMSTSITLHTDVELALRCLF